MWFRNRLAKAAFLAVLGAASFGAPMRTEEIEELLASTNRAKIEHTLRDERESGEDLIRKLLRGE
jgi:DNA-binding transcriptional ArsR family regulator